MSLGSVEKEVSAAERGAEAPTAIVGRSTNLATGTGTGGDEGWEKKGSERSNSTSQNEEHLPAFAPLPAVYEAAKRALARGWHIFPCRAHSKIPMTEHGFQDALNTDQALKVWRQGIPANPAVALEKSGLTVLDIDHGLSSIQEALAWAKSVGLPATYMVVSGRDPFGVHFYFQGVRMLPDCKNNFELQGASGGLLCHGYVLVEGSIHSETHRPYRAANDLSVAPLPEFLLNYEAKFAKTELKPDSAPRCSWSARKLQPAGKRFEFLKREAARLRNMGGGPNGLYHMLVDIARNLCEDGNNYAAENDHKLRSMADWAGSLEIGKPTYASPKPLVLERLIKPLSVDALAELLKELCPIGQRVSTRELYPMLANAGYDTKDRKKILRARRKDGYSQARQGWPALLLGQGVGMSGYGVLSSMWHECGTIYYM